MDSVDPRATARLGRLPIYRWLLPFPIVCFVGTLVTDLAYLKTAAVTWETFSIWLLTAGLVMAGLAVPAWLVNILIRGQSRRSRPDWFQVLATAIVLVLSVVNAFVHSRDGYTAVVPGGLALSGIVVAILIVAGWRSRTVLGDPRIGVVR